MKNNERLLVAAGVTIAILGTKLYYRNQQLKLVLDAHKKLSAWAKISQQIMVEIIENNPGIDLRVSEQLSTDIDFYKIIQKEDLD